MVVEADWPRGITCLGRGGGLSRLTWPSGTAGLGAPETWKAVAALPCRLPSICMGLLKISPERRLQKTSLPGEELGCGFTADCLASLSLRGLKQPTAAWVPSTTLHQPVPSHSVRYRPGIESSLDPALHAMRRLG